MLEWKAVESAEAAADSGHAAEGDDGTKLLAVRTMVIPMPIDL